MQECHYAKAKTLYIFFVLNKQQEHKDVASDEMRHLYLFIGLATQAKGSYRVVLDNQLTFLQARYRRLNLLEVLARNTEEILDDAIGYRLLLHNERILGVGIEVEELTLEAIHVLRGEDDAQSLVTPHRYQVAKWLIVKVEHLCISLRNHL